MLVYKARWHSEAHEKISRERQFFEIILAKAHVIDDRVKGQYLTMIVRGLLGLIIPTFNFDSSKELLFISERFQY